MNGEVAAPMKPKAMMIRWVELPTQRSARMLSKDDGGSAVNVGLQQRECERYAADQGWEIVQVFIDNDMSAYSGKHRPGYAALLTAIASGGVECVLVTEMTRLNRKLWHSIDLFRMGQTTELRQIVTTSGREFDLGIHAGRKAAIEAAFAAEEESMKISERVQRMKRDTATQGHYSGGQRPFGYNQEAPVWEGRKLITPGRLVVNEREAGVVREAAQMVLSGRSLRSVVLDLNRTGRTRTPDRKWWPTTLGQVLRSPRIAGIREHLGQHDPAQWPASLDKPTWDRLQLALRADGRTRGPGRQAARSYLLTGLAVCAECGNRLVGYGTQDRTATLRHRYSCRKETNQGLTRGCGQLSRLAAPVDLLVAEAVMVALESGGLAALLDQPAVTDAERKLLDLHESHKAKVEDLMADDVAGLLNRGQFAFAKQLAEQQLEQTRSQLDRFQGTRLLASVPAGESIRAWWDQADADPRRHLLRLVVSKVVISRSPGRAAVWPEPAPSSTPGPVPSGASTPPG